MVQCLISNCVCVKSHENILLPWPKKSIQPRNSWGWSTVWSCDIVRYRASVQHRRDSRHLRVASSRCRSKSMSRDITWSHCGSISEYLGCNDFYGQGSSIRERNSKKKKYGQLSWQTSVFANRVTSSFFLVSLQTCIHGYQQEMESGCCVDSRPCQREKRWERCGTSGCGGTSTKASAQNIVFQAAHEDKERNENVDVPA